MISNVYIPKAPLLSEAIHSVWQVNHSSEFVHETIIPIGIIEIIFNLEENNLVEANLGNNKYILPKCFINGFNVYPIELQLQQKHNFFGIRFYPAAIRKIFDVPAREFANCAVDLTLLDTSVNSIWHQLKEKKLFSDKVAIIISWIKKRISPLEPRGKMLNDFLCGTDQKEMTVKKVASALCYSERHLARKINDLTGMNAEKILHYKKYLRSVHLIHTTQLSLTAIAYHSGFSDQSHFIKSFKGLAQMTPGKYRQIKSYVPGHIYKYVR